MNVTTHYDTNDIIHISSAYSESPWMSVAPHLLTLTKMLYWALSWSSLCSCGLDPILLLTYLFNPGQVCLPTRKWQTFLRYIVTRIKYQMLTSVFGMQQSTNMCYLYFKVSYLPCSDVKPLPFWIDILTAFWPKLHHKNFNLYFIHIHDHILKCDIYIYLYDIYIYLSSVYMMNNT
jgi:hypothetical protein